ncbi:MAG TPA: conjugal transfer protein TraF [Vicinamibacterales bacterium]|jgi:hypothetical protein
MTRAFVQACFLAFLVFLSNASIVCAQAPDAVGVRAQGMGGAFTAVADDSTATWWNPAGLATGALFNVTVEYGALTDQDLDHFAISVAVLPLGFSYYRIPISQMQPAGSTGSQSGSRQDPGTPSVRAVDLSQFGVTVGQSIGSHFVLASSFKVANLAGDTQVGVDVGAMAALGQVRLGVMLRNLREPTFGDGVDSVTLKRQVRGGAAYLVPGRGTFAGATLAVDFDTFDVPTVFGDERRIAAGGELWLLNRLVGLRGGWNRSVIGDARTATTGGASLMLHRGYYLDGQLTGGSDPTRRGWGAAFRVTF